MKYTYQIKKYSSWEDDYFILKTLISVASNLQMLKSNCELRPPKQHKSKKMALTWSKNVSFESR